MATKWEREKQERETRMLVRVFIFFIVAGVLSGISYFILESRNRDLKGNIGTLKSEKAALESNLKEIEEKIAEKEQSFKEISEKLSQQTKK